MFWFVPRMYGPWTSTRSCVLDPSPALLLYFVFEWTVSYPSFVFPDLATYVIVSLLVSSSSIRFSLASVERSGISIGLAYHVVPI